MASVFELMKITSKISKMTDSFNRNLADLKSAAAAADADTFFKCYSEAAGLCEKIYDTAENAALYAGSESAERMLKDLQSDKTGLLNTLIDCAAESGKQNVLHALSETYRAEMTEESFQHLQEVLTSAQ